MNCPLPHQLIKLELNLLNPIERSYELVGHKSNISQKQCPKEEILLIWDSTPSHQTAVALPWKNQNKSKQIKTNQDTTNGLPITNACCAASQPAGCPQRCAAPSFSTACSSCPFFWSKAAIIPLLFSTILPSRCFTLGSASTKPF